LESKIDLLNMVVFEQFTKLARLQVCVLKELNLIEIHKMI